MKAKRQKRKQNEFGGSERAKIGEETLTLL